MGKIIHFAKDALVSLVNSMGRPGYDKAASTEYVMPEWTDQQLITSYRSSWLARKIINIPAFDTFRKWRNWQAEEGIIGLIEDEEKRLALQPKLLEALVKARLFGGAALYIGTGDNDAMAPLDLNRIKKGGVRFVNVLKRRDLTAGELEKNPESEYYGKPQYYTLNAGTQMGVRIHPSRLTIFKGDELPDEELIPSANGIGWGDSVLVSTLNEIKNADATAANVASLVFEAKVDIIKVPDLMSSLSSPDYESRLLQRFQLAKVGKGINGMLLLDAEEEHESKTASFAQLPEIIMSFLQIVAGASDIPMTRLLGMSPGGMNATGESDLRNYYDRIQATQNVSVTPALYNLTEAVIRSATGARSPDVHFVWASLWQVTDKERADIGKVTADTIKVLNDTALFPPEALANAAANMMVENSVMPGFIEEIEDAGGLPDYEAEAEAEAEMQRAALEAKAKPGGGKATVDAHLADAEPKSLYVRRDVVNAIAIRKFYEEQGLTVTVDNLHITVIHSKKEVDWFVVGEAWDEELKLGAGGARRHALFGPPGLENSLVLMVKSQQLEWRHEAFKAAGAETSYPVYQPHITLRYKDAGVDWEKFNPYIGPIELGPEIFEEVKD